MAGTKHLSLTRRLILILLMMVNATLPTGVAKYTNEGIHGPEVQFLGRSLPVTTGLIPFAGAVAGGWL